MLDAERCALALRARVGGRHLVPVAAARVLDPRAQAPPHLGPSLPRPRRAAPAGRSHAARIDRWSAPQSFACRAGFGTHRCLRAAAELARRHRWVLRLDIAKFFPSIDHAVLLGLLRRFTPDPWWAVTRRIVSAPAHVETHDVPLPRRRSANAAWASSWPPHRQPDVPNLGEHDADPGRSSHRLAPGTWDIRFATATTFSSSTTTSGRCARPGRQ